MHVTTTSYRVVAKESSVDESLFSSSTSAQQQVSGCVGASRPRRHLLCHVFCDRAAQPLDHLHPALSTKGSPGKLRAQQQAARKQKQPQHNATTGAAAAAAAAAAGQRRRAPLIVTLRPDDVMRMRSEAPIMTPEEVSYYMQAGGKRQPLSAAV